MNGRRPQPSLKLWLSATALWLTCAVHALADEPNALHAPPTIFKLGDACERLGCAEQAPSIVVYGTTSLEIVLPTGTKTSNPSPVRTIYLTGDAGEIERTIEVPIQEEPLTNSPSLLSSPSSAASPTLTPPPSFPSATLEAIRVKHGVTTATFITSDASTFLVPTPRLGATASWDVVMRREEWHIGKGFDVIFSTPGLSLIQDAQPEKTRTVTVTMTETPAAPTLSYAVEPTTTTHFVTLEPSTTTATETTTLTSFTTSFSTSTSTATESVSISYCPPPLPTPTPPCTHDEVLVPWTSLRVPSPHLLRLQQRQQQSEGINITADELGTIPMNFTHDVLLRVIDVGYRAEQYAVVIPCDDATHGSAAVHGQHDPSYHHFEDEQEEEDDRPLNSPFSYRELLGYTHPAPDLSDPSTLHMHCGTRASKRTVDNCVRLGFSEGTFYVVAGTPRVRVEVSLSAREDDYSTVLYMVSEFCHR
ncbi:hypothetical protein DL93DRAFT_2090188 [Clavulina sp. PMI_390]|nr:hypothetical protein DL93DRAFT_2090188 [Clavulina sp. PMI_390]